MKFDLDKLRDPEMAEAFKATIGGMFASLLILGASEHQERHAVSKTELD